MYIIVLEGIEHKQERVSAGRSPVPHNAEIVDETDSVRPRGRQKGL
jgi:hypothetical protein